MHPLAESIASALEEMKRRIHSTSCKMQPTLMRSHGAFYVRSDSIWPPVALKAVRLCFVSGLANLPLIQMGSMPVYRPVLDAATSDNQCLCLTGSASDGLQFILRRRRSAQSGATQARPLGLRALEQSSRILPRTQRFGCSPPGSHESIRSGKPQSKANNPRPIRRATY